MPFKIVKNGDKFDIVRADTGKVVGSSNSRAAAEASARIRMEASHGESPPPKKPTK